MTAAEKREFVKRMAAARRKSGGRKRRTGKRRGKRMAGAATMAARPANPRRRKARRSSRRRSMRGTASMRGRTSNPRRRRSRKSNPNVLGVNLKTVLIGTAGVVAAAYVGGGLTAKLQELAVGKLPASAQAVGWGVAAAGTVLLGIKLGAKYPQLPLRMVAAALAVPMAAQGLAAIGMIGGGYYEDAASEAAGSFMPGYLPSMSGMAGTISYDPLASTQIPSMGLQGTL